LGFGTWDPKVLLDDLMLTSTARGRAEPGQLAVELVAIDEVRARPVLPDGEVGAEPAVHVGQVIDQPSGPKIRRSPIATAGWFSSPIRLVPCAAFSTP
jgi:hypothetical protein